MVAQELTGKSSVNSRTGDHIQCHLQGHGVYEALAKSTKKDVLASGWSDFKGSGDIVMGKDLDPDAS